MPPPRWLRCGRLRRRIYRTTLAATDSNVRVRAALSLISQPGLYGDGTFATQLREAVIAWITVPQGTPSSTYDPGREAEPTLADAPSAALPAPPP
jgi:hypothetical protein